MIVEFSNVPAVTADHMKFDNIFLTFKKVFITSNAIISSILTTKSAVILQNFIQSPPSIFIFTSVLLFIIHLQVSRCIKPTGKAINLNFNNLHCMIWIFKHHHFNATFDTTNNTNNFFAFITHRFQSPLPNSQQSSTRTELNTNRTKFEKKVHYSCKPMQVLDVVTNHFYPFPTLHLYNHWRKDKNPFFRVLENNYESPYKPAHYVLPQIPW